MTNQLSDIKIAFLVANEGVEQVELTEPWQRVIDEGATPTLISLEAGEVQGFDHLTADKTFDATVAVADASVADYAALVLPGGVANPDQLRTDDDAVAFVTGFFEAGKPVAAICHAPWTLVEAGVLSGRTLTSWPSLRTDIENAGGSWKDEEVVVCTSGPNTLVTSRNPDDLPAFGDAIVDEVSKAAARA